MLDPQTELFLLRARVNDLEILVQRLSETEHRYKSLLKNSSEGIWRFEHDSPVSLAMPIEERIDFSIRTAFLAECNEAMARMCGAERPEDIVGKRLAELMDPGAPSTRAFMRAFFENGCALRDVESEERGPDGKPRWFRNTFVGIVEDGYVWRAWGSQTDITEQKLAEIEMRKIQRAIEGAGDAISITDLDGNITYANPAFTKILGYTFEEIRAIGGPRDIYAFEAERDIAIDELNRFGTFEGEVSLRHREGHLVLLHERIDIIRQADGTAVAVLGVRTEVGDKRRLEAQLRQAEKLAALGELVAGVAHELNNPLATISGHAQLLKRSEDESVAKRGDGILRMVDRIGRIGKSLLTFARENNPTPARHSLNEIVDEALVLCSARLRQEGISLLCELLEPAPVVFVDENQVEQIAVNLLNNAAYAMRDMPDRRLTVRTLIREGMAVLEIDDKGRGIPADIQGRVFDPFFTTKPVGEGTGLGLPICHSLALANGGSLSFQSEINRGTCFILTLPIAGQGDGA